MTVPEEAAKEPWVLPAVIGSSSDMFMIGENGLRRMQETWLDVQVMFLNETEPTVTMADRWSTLLTQQSCLIMASILRPWAPVNIKLTVAVLPNYKNVLIFGPRWLREQLNIEVMKELKVKVLGPGIMETGEQVAAHRVD